MIWRAERQRKEIRKSVLTGWRQQQRRPYKPSSNRQGHIMPDSSPIDATRIDPKLLEILVCPLTKTTLQYDAQKQELVSLAARLAYPIRDGIPIMLPEEARPLD
jgi:uncharacterized protein YbaR (Trm112 family)